MIPSPEYESVRLFYIWVMRIGMIGLAALAGILWFCKRVPKFLFPATVVALGLLYMVVLPPFSAPDEPLHFVSAYQLSSAMMGKQSMADEEFAKTATEWEKECLEHGGRVLVREEDGQKGPYPKVNRDSYQRVLENFFTMDHSQGVTVRYEAPMRTTPVVYFPQAVGITVARVLHLGYIPLILMGRLFNLLTFAALAYFAARVMPFKKEMIMAVSLLPMTLHLAASLSYDAVLIGLSMAFIGWCFHLAYEKEQVEIKDVVVLAVILVLLEPCKIVYLPLTGICLLIPAAKFGSKKRYWISVVSVICVMALSVFLVNHVVLSVWVTDTENVISWEGSAGYTFGELITHPYDTFMIYYETLVTQFDYYLTTMLGGYLGYLDPQLNVPQFGLFFLWVALLLSSVHKEGERIPVKCGQKVWIAVLVFISVCAVLFSMLLGWTPRNLTYITGIQGRYFLPILPFALVLLFGKWLTIKNDVTKGIYYLECFVSVYSLLRICSLACIR